MNAGNHSSRDDYIVTIGIECHVQLQTRTKLFSGADNDAREADPNTLVNHIDFGLPGALPVLNERAVELAVRVAFALNTKPQKFSKFDRKHYFYPDLPLGYQITQFDEPIILGGYVNIVVEGRKRTIGITRAHLEADAGKSTHPTGVDYSLVDLNRAGTPLLEIVSEPDMHTAAEAKAYARELWLAMKHAGVSDANLYYGNMRFDVNISVSKDPKVLGIRTETKNLNSFRSIERAVEYEVNRQIGVLEDGGQIIQETRGWDDTALKTFSQRTKEDAHDYRYFPDPDLPPIVLEASIIEDIEKSMPELPEDLRTKFAALDVDSATIEDIINTPMTAALVSRVLDTGGVRHARRVAFWILQAMNDEKAPVGSAEDDLTVTDEDFIALSQLVEDKKLSSTGAKEVLAEMFVSGESPALVAERLNLMQVSNEGEIEKIVSAVVAANPKAADDVRGGEMKAIGFLVGQVMKQSRGKANPELSQQLIKKQLGL